MEPERSGQLALRSKMPPASARANSALFILLILCFLSALGCSDSSLPIRFAGHVARVVMERPRLLFARAIGSRRLEGAIEQVRSDGGRLPLIRIGRQTPSARTCFEGLQPHQLLLACFILIFLSRTVLAPPRLLAGATNRRARIALVRKNARAFRECHSTFEASPFRQPGGRGFFFATSASGGFQTETLPTWRAGASCKRLRPAERCRGPRLATTCWAAGHDQLANATLAAGLTDNDWAKINPLRHLHESGGSKALSKAFDELEADPINFVHIMSAFFPDMARERIKDGLAEVGMTEDDVRELIQKLAGSDKRH
jgi:hypothetical protein